MNPNAAAAFLFAVLISAVSSAQDIKPDRADCSTNYMLEKERARLGSHTFVLVGELDDHHVLATHRSGTPPHNYQFILSFKLTTAEMKEYRKVRSSSKTLPAFTTIHFDENRNKKTRTFFCLSDLPAIFGDKRKAGDEFERLFPMRGSLLINGDHEGQLRIKESAVPGTLLELDRDDVALIFFRHLPAYLPQKTLKSQIQQDPTRVSLLFDTPLKQDDKSELARFRADYFAQVGMNEQRGGKCKADYYGPNIPLFASRHAFALFRTDGEKTVGVHLYGRAPQNYESAVEMTFDDERPLLALMNRSGNSGLFLLSDEKFCMDTVNEGQAVSGEVFHKDGFFPRPGTQKVLARVKGRVTKKLMNRRLASLLNPIAVARDVLPSDQAPLPRKFVSLAQVDDRIVVDMRYAAANNFVGQPIDGYLANRCMLTRAAAHALSRAQDDFEKLGYALIVHDCYRPQRAVDSFVKWSQNTSQKMKSEYYPKENKQTLIEKGYIASKSGHSRGATVDASLVPLKVSANTSRPAWAACAKRTMARNDTVDMGTPYDCFSPLAATASKAVSAAAQKNRQLLKRTLEKHGFKNYSKEWWHYTFQNEAFPKTYFDAPVY